MFNSNRKRSALGIVAVILLLSAGAYAYWTIGGSGSGTASAGDVDALTINQTGTLSPMYPGDTAQTLSGTFDNPNDGPVHVTSVTVAIASVDAAGTCDASDFTLADPTMSVNAEVPAGPGEGSWSGATIKFNNKASNQDGCKNATVHLSYTAA